MNTPVNPYIAGAPLRGERGFFGRQDTLEWVERELRNLQTNALVLFGQRRIGKTTLLLQLARNLSQDDFIPIYFDLQDQASRPLGKTLCDIADILTEKAGVDLGETGPYDDQGRYFQREFLPRFYEAIGDKRRPVFLLDEFDVLDQSAEAALVETATAKALFPLLRRLMTTDGRTAFVFVVGRRAEDLSIDFNATFKASLVREIWVLDNRSAESLVRHAEANGTLKFTDRAVQRVLSLTNYHPYLTQLLCQRVWELAYAAGPSTVPTVDEAQVDTALESSLEAGNQALDWLWNGLNPAEKIYAAALAEIAGENETIPEERIIEVLATHAARLRTREIELAPRDLVKRHVLDTSGERGYRFAVELFRRWVHKNKPLVVVKDEVDRINPMADQMFVFGDGFYDARNWEKAAYYFREALEVNPRHFRARLYLGETLLEQQKVDEAITELDQAFLLDREEVRLPLARAWLAKADQLKSGDDLDALMKAYDKVLELSPRESQAIQGRSAVWAQRAQQAEAEGDLDAAIEASRQAGDTANLDRLNRVVRERLLKDLEQEARAHEQSGVWEPAVQVYTRMVALAPDDERRLALEKEVERVAALAAEQQARDRLQALEQLRTRAEDHEQRGDWDGAVQVYEQLGELAGEESWRDPLEKARREQELSAVFEQGCQAMQNEDWKDAQALFAQLIQARPDYNRDGQYAAALLQDAIQHRKRPVRLRLPSRSGGLFSRLSVEQKVWFRFLAFVLGLLVLAGAIQGGVYLNNYYKPGLRVGDVKSAISLPEETISLASVGALEPADVWYFEASANNMAVSPDGGTLAVALKADWKSLSDYTTLIDRETGTVQQILEGHSSNVTGVDFSPDGSLLATGSRDSTVKLWDVSSGGLLRTLEGHSDWVQSVDISTDGLLLASGSDDDTVRIWSVEDGNLLHTLEGHGDNVLKVAFSPDDSLLASASFDNTVRIWGVEDGSLLHTLEGHTADVRSVAFSPDGLVVASAAEDGTVIVWQVEDGSPILSILIGETGSIVFDVSFSADSQLLAVAAGDDSGIWQIADGLLLSSAGEYLYKVAFSPDGRFLVAAESGTIRFWTINPGQLAVSEDITADPTPVAMEAPGEITAEPVNLEAEITDAKGVEMVLVPAGDFVMDIDTQLYLDDFYIDRYEVTNELYEACVDVHRCDPPTFSESSTRNEYFLDEEFMNYPVIYVNWDMARSYCQWRGARLPTEAEWVKAARGEDDRLLPWGSEEVDCSYANYYETLDTGSSDYCVGDTTEIGSYADGVSPYGIYDMAGNVMEWVSSLYLSYPYQEDDGREDLTTPGARARRGGSWSAQNIYLYTRFFGNPASSYNDTGFRCALDP